ncbi:RNA polymerase sigma factor [Acetohalobium arabaticum]|uniref:RNA polymerase, sigma-24 subunit, ECF subfamily n=1 Tax=Acetohalobium arabaticum (strain ATCC 49924 / DSM 5501 / Z-7288) TaxID=574087 RepID=D9QQ52_ACEAZ|nr:sigma-70 family RNA polymerase sigma factor [Acetohalobium arabaticum]ADL12643.1 RNA polymerase, sigma-24 subunit, ECF subfamily [Acetohalobium arabaticum DSM 5501]
MDKEDKRLIADCKKGNNKAFRLLINKYKQDCLNAAYQLVSDKELAEDIAQEAFVRIYKSIDNFRGDSSFFTWVYQIILNLCRDHFRKQPKENPVSLEDSALESILRKEIPDSDDVPENHLEKQELQRIIKESLTELSFKHRQVIVLRDLQGFTYKRIAEILEIPLGTVKSRLNTARNRLQKKLAVAKRKYIK